MVESSRISEPIEASYEYESAVILDCLDQRAKQFYQRFDFEELPGYPMKLYLSCEQLEKMMS